MNNYSDDSINKYISLLTSDYGISFRDIELNDSVVGSGNTYWWNKFKESYPAIAKDNPAFDSNVSELNYIPFFKFTPDQLEEFFGLKNIDLTVYINFEYKIILSDKSVRVDGNDIFSLFELSSDTISYDYNSESATLDAIIRIDEIANYGTSKKIKLTLNTENVEQSNDIIQYRIRKAYYKNASKANKWIVVDDLKECSYSDDGSSVSFSVYESGDYFFRLEDVDGAIVETMERYNEFNVKNRIQGDSRNYVKIDPDVNGNPVGYKILLANKPVVTNDMVPIKWVYDDSTRSTGCWVVCSTFDPEWYNYSYETKMWANIMFKNDVTAVGRGFEIGTEYKEGQTGSMFVWIPRFATTVEILKGYTTVRQYLDAEKYYNIQFLRDCSNTTTFGTNAFTDRSISLLANQAQNLDYSDSVGKVVIPPAFSNKDSLNGSWDTELKGLWFAKYNTGLDRYGNTSVNTSNTNEFDKMYVDSQGFNPVSKPYYIMWRNIRFTNAFSQSLMFAKKLSDANDINTHLMKGTEYDVLKAITYNGEFGNQSLQGNFNNRMAGGSDGVNGYSITRFQGQSTTGNMSGIFDTAGATNYLLSSIITNMESESLYSSNNVPLFYHPGNLEWQKEYYADMADNKYLQVFYTKNLNNFYSFCGNLKTQNGKVLQVSNQIREWLKIRELTAGESSSEDTYNQDGENVGFRIVLTNSSSGTLDSLLYDRENRIPSQNDAGFFETYESGEFIRNESGEYKDLLGNPTYFSWQTLINNGWIAVENRADGSVVAKAGPNIYANGGLKYKTGILVIPDGITVIGDGSVNMHNSFNHWSSDYDKNGNRYGNLLKVILPDTVTDISNYAFDDCGKLLTVKFSNSLKTIGHCSFAHCTSLNSVALPETLTKLGGNDFVINTNSYNTYSSFYGRCFEGCTSIESIVIPRATQIIGYKTFYRLHKFIKFRIYY